MNDTGIGNRSITQYEGKTVCFLNGFFV